MIVPTAEAKRKVDAEYGHLSDAEKYQYAQAQTLIDEVNSLPKRKKPFSEESKKA